MVLLSETEIERRVGEMDGWELKGSAISKTFQRKGFVGSVEFVNQIVEPAEEMGHHPDLEISWDKVTVSITSHSEGGLTPTDFELATRIDGLRA